MANIVHEKLETPSGRLFDYAYYTDPGSRAINEDCCAVEAGSHLTGFFLCDGLGGHGMGDVASGLVVRSLREQLKDSRDLEKYIPEALQKAQENLLLEQERQHAAKKMKTTAVLLVTDGDKICAGHVGDSRLYYFRHGRIKKRTLDHSIPQMMVLTREIKEADIRNHPERSMLLRVMGTAWDEPKYELQKTERIGKYDAFLLCSDGFWELITEHEIETCFKESVDTADWLQRMTKIVNQNGAGKNMDNNTAIVIRVLKG